MKIYLKHFVVLGLFLMLTACGIWQPVKNVESQPVPSNITSAEEVKDSIMRAGASLGWGITSNGPNELKGVLKLRTHQAVISIPYSADKYSLIYMSSINLTPSEDSSESGHDYNDDSDKLYIHKNYNGWISNLDQRIQVYLQNTANWK